MKLKIITIGKPKGEFEKLFTEYIKRLSGFVKVDTHFIKEDYNNPEIAEEKALQKAEKTFIVLLDETGVLMTSHELSSFLEKKENQSIGEISFMIGGPNGHSDHLKQKSNFLLSFSKLTFPHDLAMVILAETLYRSFSIIKNHPYHRD
jgi:23S rRNA (pseudouridine1915-N3)-methyltransferase